MFDRDRNKQEGKPEPAVKPRAPNTRYGPIPEGFVNITGAAEHLGVGAMNIRRIVSLGKVEGSYKEENGRWIIPLAGLDKYQLTKGTRRSDGKKAFVIKIDPEQEAEVLKALQPFGVEALVLRYKPKKAKEEEAAE